MKNIYYQIWTDAIFNDKAYKSKEKNWKFGVFGIITFCNSLNLYTIDIILKLLGLKTLLLKINFFPINSINSLISHLIRYTLIFIILNYLLIFHKNRFKKLEIKYNNKNGKLALLYIICSAIFAYASAMIYGVFKS